MEPQTGRDVPGVEQDAGSVVEQTAPLAGLCELGSAGHARSPGLPLAPAHVDWWRRW